MSEEEREKPISDPAEMWIQLYDNWAKTWASAMSEAVASERFVESAVQQMEGGIGAAELVQRQTREIMERALEQMHIPTREQVISLAQRMTEIEVRLDDIQAGQDDIHDQLQQILNALQNREAKGS